MGDLRWVREAEQQVLLNPQTKGEILRLQNLRLNALSTKPQTKSELLSPPAYVPVSTQPYLCLPSDWIKGVESQVLGSPLCHLYFSFRQIQSPLAWGVLKLSEIHLSTKCWDLKCVPPLPGLYG